MSRPLLIPLLALALLLGAAAPAFADGEYEPNNNFDTAYTPFGNAGGLHVVDAGLETLGDEDWYRVYVPRGRHQLSASLQVLASPDFFPLYIAIVGPDNRSLAEKEEVRDVERVTYTVEGPGAVAIKVASLYDAEGARYRLTLDGDWPATDPRQPAPSPSPSPTPDPADPAPAATPCSKATQRLKRAVRAHRRASRAYRKRPNRSRRATLKRARTERDRASRAVARSC